MGLTAEICSICDGSLWKIIKLDIFSWWLGCTILILDGVYVVAV